MVKLSPKLNLLQAVLVGLTDVLLEDMSCVALARTIPSDGTWRHGYNPCLACGNILVLACGDFSFAFFSFCFLWPGFPLLLLVLFSFFIVGIYPSFLAKEE